jgi:hypothetical protein
MSTRATGLLVVLTLVGCGCSSATSSRASSVTATGSVVATIATESSTTAQPAAGATAAALSDVGVKIVDAPAPVSSAPSLTLTRAQVQFMEAEASTRGGLRGDVLDAAGGGAPSGVPMSAVLAGYVRGVQTPAAEFARSVMAGQDLTHPDGAVFPTAVLVLFAADAAKAFAPDQVTPSGLRRSSLSNVAAAPTRRAGGGICSDVTKSIFDAVESLFAKIHIPPGKVGDTGSSFLNGVLQGLTDVVVGSLNFIIDAAKTLIVNGIKYLLDQVLSVVAEVAAAAALIGNFVSAVRPWKLELTPEASATSKGIDPDRVYDSVTAKAILVGPTDDWPDWFADCSKTAGVPLPSLLPVDAGVVWKVSVLSADLMKESEDQIPKETKLHKDAAGGVIAKLGLVTGMESVAQAETGQPQEGSAWISVTARREQIADLRKTLIAAVNDLAGRVLVVVPAIIRDYLLKLVAEAADSSSDKLASLLDASTVSIIAVTYHGLPEPVGSAPISSGPKNASEYCALFIDFANWSLANLEAITAEASEPTFTVRDAFFAEYLVRMAAMQKVEPTELHDALATFAMYAQLYLAHDMSAVLAQAKAMAPAGALINGYGKQVCRYDPQVTTGG